MGADANTLIVQPGAGACGLIHSMNSAEKSIDILIFRFDLRELERALIRAVGRGVRVRALVAHTNRGGERSLRALEMRLLAAGVTVSRTATDLVRYHGKMMIVDDRELYVLGFNFTHIDVDRSRSFGLLTRDKATICAAQALFDADCGRSAPEFESDSLVVSPVNARRLLGDLVAGAKTELLIYDVSVSDPAMRSLLLEQQSKGVSVRILGGAARGLDCRRPARRLHSRVIVRDGARVFIGSQSLRALELDRRREIGVIVESREIADAVRKAFEEDWLKAVEAAQAAVPARKIAKRVAEVIVGELPPVDKVLANVAKAFDAGVKLAVSSDEFQESVVEAVRQAVRETVQDAVEEANHT